MTRLNRDAVLGAAMLAVAIGYYVMSTRIQESALEDSVGPAGLPKIYAGVLAGLSLILMARALQSAPDIPRSGLRGLRDLRVLRGYGPVRMAVLLLIGIAYVVAVPWLGYLVSIGGLIAATSWHEGGVFDRRVALVAVAGAAFFWVLFVVALGIQQPPGIWPALF